MNRRNSIKAASCGALLTDALPSVNHVAAESRPPIPGLPETLYDSTLYVSCQACITKCQDTNFPEHNPQGEQAWPGNDKPSPHTNNITRVWTSDTRANKDREEDGYAYIKRQYMHCVDLSCVSVCPVFALKRGPKAGTIRYDKDVCVGYRYCMVAYPYNVLRYDYNNPFGALHGCELRNQKGVERPDKGGPSSYVEAYPVGVMILGTRKGLTTEAEKRLALELGSECYYPRQMLKSSGTYLHMVSKHYPCLYGGKGGGGTQALVLTGVPYENLDLPKLNDLFIGARSEHVRHTLYKGTVLPLAALAGPTVLARRNTKNDHRNEGDGHES